VPLTSGGVFSVRWTAEMAFAVIKFNIRLFPVGSHLWPGGERRGRHQKVADSAS
jgi:hypothetical protein